MRENEHEERSGIDFRRMEDVAETASEKRELIDLYLTSTRGHLEDLKAAISGNDATEVRRLAHTAAGASATCGIDSIVPLLKQIENNGRAGVLADCEALRLKAVAEFSQIQGALQQYLQTL